RDPPPQQGQGQGPVGGPGVQVAQPGPLGDPPGDRALARPGRAVAGHGHLGAALDGLVPAQPDHPHLASLLDRSASEAQSTRWPAGDLAGSGGAGALVGRPAGQLQGGQGGAEGVAARDPDAQGAAAALELVVDGQVLDVDPGRAEGGEHRGGARAWTTARVLPGRSAMWTTTSRRPRGEEPGLVGMRSRADRAAASSSRRPSRAPSAMGLRSTSSRLGSTSRAATMLGPLVAQMSTQRSGSLAATLVVSRKPLATRRRNAAGESTWATAAIRAGAG